MLTFSYCLHSYCYLWLSIFITNICTTSYHCAKSILCIVFQYYITIICYLVCI